MTAASAREYLLSKPEAVEDYPFGPDVMVFKVKGKMFALLSFSGGKNPDKRAQMNLKCDPLEATQLRDVFDDVIAGYHMNKKHWNTLYLTDGEKISDIPVGEVERQIDNSYALVLQGMTKALRRSLEVSYSNEQLYGE
ncbi:MAG: MmcQ/YjbR family DNA-binding protein [Oleispira sp.]|nr:MmcQ/YjbR family DNA-binding protein [Oleispira sp.]MBL4881090.1 MmcQ/YjbR family DNA-binding protein [Oleispira sp.]